MKQMDLHAGDPLPTLGLSLHLQGYILQQASRLSVNMSMGSISHSSTVSKAREGSEGSQLIKDQQDNQRLLAGRGRG